jgi:hypothetical protein
VVDIAAGLGDTVGKQHQAVTRPEERA